MSKYAICYSIFTSGSVGHVVEIEAFLNNGLPGIHLVGSTDASLQEAKERVKAALANSGFTIPSGKMVISLSPASLPKIGSGFDLGIAVAIFSIIKGLNNTKSKAVFMGELSLGGKIKPVNGILKCILSAKKAGHKTIMVPLANLKETTKVTGITILGADSFSEVAGWLFDEFELTSPQAEENIVLVNKLDFSEVLGQAAAKKALEIAAAGGHNILMVGAPGVGKTMLAKRFPSILPELSLEESLEVTALYSQAGKLPEGTNRISIPPFVSPHYKSSLTSLIGGGTGVALPGAISFANRGVLFLDEFTEIGVKTLEALRTPLEEGLIRIARRDGTVTYPANFQLIIAANPCPCAPVRDIDCECTPSAKNKYRQKISGPLLDRVDIRMKLILPSLLEVKNSKIEKSETIKQRVIAARERSSSRWGESDTVTNATVSNEILQAFKLKENVLQKLYQLIAAGNLSLRGMNRLIRIAWTIADLKGNPEPTEREVAAAIALRQAI